MRCKKELLPTSWLIMIPNVNKRQHFDLDQDESCNERRQQAVEEEGEFGGSTSGQIHLLDAGKISVSTEEFAVVLLAWGNLLQFHRRVTGGKG